MAMAALRGGRDSRRLNARPRILFGIASQTMRFPEEHSA